MAQTLIAPVPVAEEDGPHPRLWTREEVYATVQAGILQENPRTELIAGQVYVQPVGDHAHTFGCASLTNLLQKAFGKGYSAMTKLPLPLDDHNELWPDVGVIPDEALEQETSDVERVRRTVLVAEVADRSLEHDRTFKSALYAAHGVPEYWIVSLRERTLEVRRKPMPERGEYGYRLVLREGEVVTVGGGAVAVPDVLPRVASRDEP